MVDPTAGCWRRRRISSVMVPRSRWASERLPFCGSTTRAMGGAHRLLLGRPRLRVLGGGVLEPLRLTVERPQLAQLVGALAPAEEAERRAQPGDEPDEGAQGIPQQVEVGGIVDIALDHEGVSTHLQQGEDDYQKLRQAARDSGPKVVRETPIAGILKKYRLSHESAQREAAASRGAKQPPLLHQA